MKHYLAGVALAIAVFGFAACGNNNAGTLFPGVKPGVYQQVELWGRPAVKEGLEVFNAHDATNRSEPYSDPTLSANVSNFMTTVAGRDATTSATVTKILSTNEMVVNLSQSAVTAAYLGVETGGALGRSKFGGRALNDDAVSLDLGVVFGNTLAKVGAVSDDFKEHPCLTTDNVGPQNPNNGPFPFLDPPV
ncbi:MAG: hypothetical protein DLM53_01150 [Candidatus Eremiobacter antarcticus]|nr:MAG: hypothetical protein DLM50_07135 [Candidatus Eremiobacteraeota bacterium]PZR64353.1 MAG: hypothetical protein DLM53_01150 [Candidatus Eremiobacter sp. RRmetagenome_bin22]